MGNLYDYIPKGKYVLSHSGCLPPIIRRDIWRRRDLDLKLQTAKIICPSLPTKCTEFRDLILSMY